MKKHFIVLSSFYCLNLSAQLNYSFQKTTAQYSELTGAKRISFQQLDDLSGFYRLDELKGETFVWYNTKFKIDTIKTIHIQPYANLRFDNDTNLIIVDAAFTYLDSIDATSSVSYEITGNSGDKVLKVQWKNVRARVGKSGNFMNVQIHVFQKSGVIEIHYGPSSADNQSGFGTSNGPQTGMFYSRDDFTRCFEKLWVIGSPSSIRLDSVANYDFRAMSGIPLSETVFRFVPRFNIASINKIQIQRQDLHRTITENFTDVSIQGSFIILNHSGQIVHRGCGPVQLDIADWANGIYYLSSETQREVWSVLHK